MTLVFANRKEDEVIYPSPVNKIAQAQQDDPNLQALTNKDKYTLQLVENMKVFYKDNKLVVPATLPHRVFCWYHHDLQHLGSTFLEETLCISMQWKGICHTIQSCVKNCKKCQVNE